MMTDAQIRRAANDTDGTSGWSPEVRYLAALVVRRERIVDKRDKALEDLLRARADFAAECCEYCSAGW